MQYQCDRDRACIIAGFEAVPTGHDDSAVRRHNTNFWRVRDRKFQEIYDYMSGANVLN